MSVINCSASTIRPLRLKEWLLDPQHVYIAHRKCIFIDGEQYPKTDSIWANPFKIGRDGTREEVVCAYESLIRDRIQADPLLLSQLLSLKGKVLGCWCAPELCHGDALLRLIDEFCNEEHKR